MEPENVNFEVASTNNKAEVGQLNQHNEEFLNKECIDVKPGQEVEQNHTENIDNLNLENVQEPTQQITTKTKSETTEKSKEASHPETSSKECNGVKSEQNDIENTEDIVDEEQQTDEISEKETSEKQLLSIETSNKERANTIQNIEQNSIQKHKANSVQEPNKQITTEVQSETAENPKQESCPDTSSKECNGLKSEQNDTENTEDIVDEEQQKDEISEKETSEKQQLSLETSNKECANTIQNIEQNSIDRHEANTVQEPNQQITTEGQSETAENPKQESSPDTSSKECNGVKSTQCTEQNNTENTEDIVDEEQQKDEVSEKETFEKQQLRSIENKECANIIQNVEQNCTEKHEANSVQEPDQVMIKNKSRTAEKQSNKQKEVIKNTENDDFVTKSRKSSLSLKKSKQENIDTKAEDETQLLNTENEEESKKSKRKSRLSLNSDKNKSKYKEDTSQASITSFFQKMSPKTPENIKQEFKLNVPVHTSEEKYIKEKRSNEKKVEKEKKDHNSSKHNKKGKSLSKSEEKLADIEGTETAQAAKESKQTSDKSKLKSAEEAKSPKYKQKSKTKTDAASEKEPLENGTKRNKKIKKESVEPTEIKSKPGKAAKKSLENSKEKLPKEQAKINNVQQDTVTVTTSKKEAKETTSDKSKDQSKVKNKSREESANKEKKTKKEKLKTQKHQEEIKKSAETNKTEKADKKGRNNYKNESTHLTEKENQNINEKPTESIDIKEHNKKVRFSEEIQEFSPEPVRKNSASIVEDPSAISKKEEIEVEECYGEKRQEESKTVKNAFTFMMDNRYKSIGQNSPGKDEEKCEDLPEAHKESKKKMSARKAIFQDWADAKGAKKRKIEDEEKGVVIEHKLKKRAKRLKKMLTEKATPVVAVVDDDQDKQKATSEVVVVDDSQNNSEILLKKHKVSRIIDSDSEDANSKDIKIKNQPKKKQTKRKRASSVDAREDLNLQKEVDVVDVEDSVDGEIFIKHKKPKLIVSDSSSNDSISVNEEKLNGNSSLNEVSKIEEKTNDSLSEKKLKNKQTELSSFFAVLNSGKKSDTTSRNKLQLKHDSESENSSTKRGKKKNTQNSKLSLKKRDSNNSLTSDDLSNSQNIINGHAPPENGDIKECNRNGNLEIPDKIKKREIQMALTPRTLQKWKMRLKVNLLEADDETIEKLLQSHSDKLVVSEDEQEILPAVSDDEKEILPKSKKKLKVIVSSDSDSDEPLACKKYCKEKSAQRRKSDIKPVKLAPMFIKAKPKPKLDQAIVEARRKFLHSGLPESLQKVIEKQQRVEEIDYPIFPTISHVTIKPTNEQLADGAINFWNLPVANLNLPNSEPYSPTIGLLSRGFITDSNATDGNKIEFQPLSKIKNMRTIVKSIKAENLDYPVYKAFRVLYQKHTKKVQEPEAEVKPEPKVKKSKKGRPKKKVKNLDDSVEIVEVKQPEIVKQDPHKQELWTEMYKPCTSDEIFGNHSSISRLKAWLETWLEFSEEINMQKKRKRRNSDSCSDFESTDADSQDSTSLPGNTMILCGPHGSGKTCAVYALCSELGVNVLELNASSKRTGKRLLLELQEATQSHQVRKKDANSLTAFLKKDDNSQSSQSSDSQASNSNKKMCLLLIEDVDIVFEQDETFISALGQLLSTSKRPIVLTTTDTNCLHLKKIFVQHPIITFVPLSAKILAVWLQLLCLVEGLLVDKRAIAELLEQNKGDVRCTLLQLQFWAQSGGQAKSEVVATSINVGNTDIAENLDKDDNSNISWLNEEESDGIVNTNVHNSCWDSFGHFKACNSLYTSVPLDLGNLWWNLSSILSIPLPLSINNQPVAKTAEIVEDEQLEKEKPDRTESENLKSVSDIFETLAMTDVLYEKLNVDCDLEPVHRSTDRRIKNSLELNESIENYCISRDLSYEWSHTLLDGHINLHKKSELSSNFTYSAIEEKRWRAKQNKCKETLLDAVPLLCSLDRNPINTDYLSTLRTMARSEVIRANTNHKRRNRFYNYLRGLGIDCNDSLFQTASNVFHCEL